MKPCLRVATAILLYLFTPAFSLAQPAYFQQEVKYVVHVSLDDRAHFLRGSWELEYTNRSSVSLDSIYMHLWPNAYKGKNTSFAQQQREANSMDFHFSDAEDKGFIDSLRFTSGGTELKWNYVSGEADVAIIHLAQPLPPNATVKMSTPFRVKIPSDFSRCGHVGQQYQITQWMPKPAVFDRNGWHPIPYLDQGEFYSEYGSFDVFIDVPRNYVVGATGDLPQGDPEYQWLASREKKSRELLDKPAGQDTFQMEFAAGERKTLHFHQEDVHDFAWFCDKQYYVLTDSVALPQSGRKVQCVAMFPARVKRTWKNGPAMVAAGVYHYSQYNGDYPYRHCTAVEGALSAGGGMEYPNITVVSAGGSELGLEEVIVHEVGHNWFYGILGSNEREHPWMDEGLNTYFENRFMVERHHDETGFLPTGITRKIGLDLTHTRMLQEAYNLTAGANEDQPIEMHSADYSSTNYGTIVYMKTGYAFRYLENFLSRQVIDRCFAAYYEKWKFKHPQPEDIQAVFEKTSGKDLDWFFGDFVKTTGKLNFRVKKVEGSVVTVQNLSDVEAPVAVTVFDKEGNVLKTRWSEPFTGETTVDMSREDFHHVRVNAGGVAPEVRQENNHLKAKGLFRRCKPWTLNFLYKFPDPAKTQFAWAPLIGYNTEDGFMAGLGLYHHIFPKQKFEFHLMPMYGFDSQTLTGLAGFSYRIFPAGVLKKIQFTSRTAAFADFLRTHNRVELFLKEKNARKPLNQVIGLHLYHGAVRNGGSYNLENYYKPLYASLNWQLSQPLRVDAFRASAELGANVTEGVYRANVAASYDRRLTKKMKAGIRVFGGVFFGDANVPYLLQYRASGSGDPFGQTYMPDRSERSDFFSHQLISDHGAMNSLLGHSFNRHLLAANVYYQLHPMISLFGDFAGGRVVTPTGFFATSGLLYDAGISLHLAGPAVKINFPIAGSCFTNGLPDDFREWWGNINFNLDLLRVLQGIGIPGLN